MPSTGSADAWARSNAAPLSVNVLADITNCRSATATSYTTRRLSPMKYSAHRSEHPETEAANILPMRSRTKFGSSRNSREGTTGSAVNPVYDRAAVIITIPVDSTSHSHRSYLEMWCTTQNDCLGNARRRVRYSFFDGRAAVEHDDRVRPPHRRQAVGDDQHRA